MAIDFSNIDAVKDRIKEIQIECAEHSISKNRKTFKADTISIEVEERRKILVPELLQLENRLRQLNTTNKVKRDSDKDVIWKDCLYELLIETINRTEFKKFTTECINRTNGLEPKKIVLDYGNNEQDKIEIKRLAKIANELKDTLILARKQIDKYIRQNEPEVNKADYHLKVRELISCMPPEKEIFKIKINNQIK